MAFRVRTLACTALLFFLTTISLSASSNPLQAVIKPTTSRVQFIRFQIGTEAIHPWTEVDASNPILVLDAFDSAKDILYIQQSEDKQSWSSSYEYRYDPSDKIWILSPSKAVKKDIVETLDLKLYGLFPVNKSSTYYSYVLGVGVKANIALDKQKSLIGYGEIAYSAGPSKSDWVDSMQAFNISFGLGYRFACSGMMQITPELGYGLVIHLLNADFDEDGTKAFETFADQQIRLSLNFCYAFTDTYSLIVAPLGVLFFEKGTVGTLFGIQTGLRFNF